MLRTVDIGELNQIDGSPTSHNAMLYGCTATTFSNLMCSESIDLSTIINGESDQTYAITYTPSRTRHESNWGSTKNMTYMSYPINLEYQIPLYMQTSQMSYTIVVFGSALELTYPNTWIWPQGIPDFSTASNGAEIAIQVLDNEGTMTVIANYQIF